MSHKSHILKLVIVFLTFSCSSSKEHTSASEWLELKGAADGKCKAWPLRAEDLAVLGIEALQVQDQHMFLVKTRLRDGGLGYYLAPPQKSKSIDVEGAVTLNLGARPFVIGAFQDGETSLIALLSSDPKVKGKVFFELRAQPKNVVWQRWGFNASNILWARAGVTKAGVWLFYKEGISDEDSIEDLALQVIFFPRPKPGQNTRAQPLPMTFENFPNDAQALEPDPRDSSARAQVVWIESASESLAPKPKAKSKTPAKKSPPSEDSDKGAQLVIVTLDASKRMTSKTKIVLKLEESLESWSMMHSTDGLYLAMVDGDSVVGRAQLRLSLLAWDGEYARSRWEKKVTLKDQHISEPFWVKGEGTHKLLLPRWLDKESTVGVFAVDSTDLLSAKNVGVFAEGARIVDGYFSVADEASFGIVRTRKGQKWSYELCRF